MTPLPLAEAQRLAAKFAPPPPAVASSPPEPIRHWNRVKILLTEDGPCTYIKVARRIGITTHHANTLLQRLLRRGLISIVIKGIPGPSGRPTVYGLRDFGAPPC